MSRSVCDGSSLMNGCANANDTVDSDTDFEDAIDELTLTPDTNGVCSTSVSPLHNNKLGVSINEAKICMGLFMNNRFEEARERCEPLATTSVYHSLSYSTLVFIRALLTCEPSHMEHAVASTKAALQVCERYRRQTSLTESVGRMVRWDKTSVVQLTDDEMHAELCYAECLLQRALLTFLQDDNLVSFVKGAYKIRTCYQSYRACERLLLSGDWSNRAETTRRSFESGTHMGVGTFNLMIASLPAKILKMLEFAGFSANKADGLSQLGAGAAMDGTLRSPLCSMILLGWHLFCVYLFGLGDCDLRLCSNLLAQLSAQYPQGALVLFCEARYRLILGQLPGAIDCMQQSIAVQSELSQLHHVCYWELIFCHMIAGEWLPAAEYAQKLYEQNKWSKCVYAYIWALLLLAHKDDLTNDQHSTMCQLFTEVPSLRQRFAGKSLPLEKFCAVKAKCFENTQTLELIYFWTGFQLLTNDSNLMKSLLQQTELAVNARTSDDRALGLFLQAMCLKNLQSPFQAEQCLLKVTEMSSELDHNSYLAPSAWFELALLQYEQGHLEAVQESLNRVKPFKGYSMESRLLFRVHALKDKLTKLSPKQVSRVRSV